MKTSTAQCRLWIAGDTKAARDPGRGVVAVTNTGRKKFRSFPEKVSHALSFTLKQNTLSMVHDVHISDACA